MPGEPGSARRQQRAFVIGELLVAVLLLAVAVSSLAALMYSVSHRSDARGTVACVEKGAATGKCAAPAGGGAKVLRSACGGKSAATAKGCVDSAVYRGESGAVILRSRADSASLAVVAKKQKVPRETVRPDRGFMR